MAVTALDIVNSAYKLLGGNYRVWQDGDSTPTWLDDDEGDPPSVDYLKYWGVDGCGDLINFALEDNGLPQIYGTLYMPDYLVNTRPFEPDVAGQPGAVAIKRYQGPDLGDQGHVVLYVGEHQVIQALPWPWSGVTDAYTDKYMYSLGGDFLFETYGLLPGVTYGSGGQSEAPTPS